MASGRELQPYHRAWTSTDALLYALAVGSGQSELAFVTENSHGVTQAVLPTFALVVGSPVRAYDEIGEFDRSQMLHLAQRLCLYRPLAPEGTVVVQERIVELADKGPGRSAVLTLATEARAPEGELTFTTEMTILIRGQGGFGGEPGQSRAPGSPLPSRQADLTVVQRTNPEQALLYRLTGDRTPLHSDPWFARERLGFPGPILHGLCTFGFAGRALLFGLCDGDPGRFKSMAASFTAPVFPGEALTTRIWRTDAGAQFVTTASADDRVVLGDGEFRSEPSA